MSSSVDLGKQYLNTLSMNVPGKAMKFFALAAVLFQGRPVTVLKRSRSKMHLVFVYGTLKRGEPNHYLLCEPETGAGKFVSLGTTVRKYPLVIASKYNIPFLLDKKDVGKQVNGEIFEVDDAMLETLDKLENHPNYYVRRRELIATEENGEKVNKECWTYLLPSFRESLLNLPHLANYCSKGDHGRNYVESEETETEEQIYDS